MVNSSRTLKRLFWIVFFVILLSVPIGKFLLNSLTDRALDSSIREFLKKNAIQHSVVKKILHPYVVDPQGVWAIEIFGKIELSPPFSEAEFSPSYYAAEGLELFPGFLNPKDAMIFKFETPLGDGTICEFSDCKVYIVLQKDKSKAIIWIG